MSSRIASVLDITKRELVRQSIATVDKMTLKS